MNRYKKRSEEVLPILKPYNIVLITFFLSFLAWLFPDFGYLRKGFTIKEDITLFSLLLSFSWFGLIFLSSYFGFHFGKANFRKIKYIEKIKKHISFDRNSIYYIYTVIACIGVSSAFYKIYSELGIIGIFYSLSSASGNDLKESLYEEYSLGLLSLRYVVGLSGGISLFKLFILKQRGLIEFLNILLLLSSALISSRLTFVFSLLVFATLYGRKFRWPTKSKLIRLVLVGFAIFTILSGYNYFRNYTFYRDYGTANFWGASISEIVTYLGAPFQVSLGIGNNIDRATIEVTHEHYFRGSDEYPYMKYVDIDPGLTTNSSFAELFVTMGFYSFPHIFLVTFFLSILLGLLANLKDNYLYLAYPVILYGFAELWRLDLFYRGIFITLLTVSLIVPLVYPLIFGLITKRKPLK